MKRYPPAVRTKPPRRPHIPQFHAVPARARRDGWTPRRQAEFIGWLAETRSVAEAAKRVSMARETAYRLRRRPWAEGFAAAWDAAMGRAPHTGGRQGDTLAPGDGERPQVGANSDRKVTTEELAWRVETGFWQIRVYAGKFVGLSQKHDNSALLRLLQRIDPLPRAPRSEAAAR